MLKFDKNIIEAFLDEFMLRIVEILIDFFKIAENLSPFSARKLLEEKDILSFWNNSDSRLQRNKSFFMNIVISHVKDSQSRILPSQIDEP